MSNYIIIHKASNLIVKLIASSIKLKGSMEFRAIRVSDAMLGKYDKLLKLRSRNGTLVDAGELATVSPAFFELLQAHR